MPDPNDRFRRFDEHEGFRLPPNFFRALRRAEERVSPPTTPQTMNDTSDLNDLWMARCYTDLAARLVAGEVRRAFGRDEEVGELLRMLASPLPRHPVLLGPASVGKTAVAQEVAARIHRGECPEPLRGLRLLATSPRQLMGGLPPGDGWRAALTQLWERLRAEGPFLLLLANAHEAVGMGSRGNDSDLASALAESLLGSAGRTGTHILAEARADRWSHLATTVTSYTGLFVPFRMHEPEGDTLAAVLEAASAELEEQHSVLVTPAARQRAVDLTRRYVVREAMPGKALALLEEAMAAQAGGEEGVPEIGPREVTGRFAQRTGLPMVLLDEAALWDEEAVRATFQGRVLGQELAVDTVLQRLGLLKAGLHDPSRPLGVFLFIGPTGVGKTELAKTLTTFLFGHADSLVRMNMADYSEFWQFSQLFGSPDPEEPLEVQRGQLTTRLADHTFTILLLDEFEKAHPNIFQRFLQLFDEGMLINGAGEEVNLRNSLIILTSNLAADMRQKAIGFVGSGSVETMEQRVMRTAEEYFTPEFVNRIDQIVFFHPLNRQTIRKIAFRELERLFQREGILRRNVQIEWDDSVVDWIVERGWSERFGARFLRRQIEKSISYPIARALISQPIEPGSLLRVFLRGVPGQIEAVAVPPREVTALGEETLPVGGGRRAMSLSDLAEALPTLRARVAEAVTLHDIEALRARRDAGLAAMARPDFWEGEGNPQQLEELGALSGRVELVDGLLRALDEAEDLLTRARGEGDRGIVAALGRRVHELTRDLERAELDLSFTDAWDPLDAWLTVTPGNEEAGATGWAAEVVEMYAGWGRKHGFEAAVVEEELGLHGGLLRARLRVTGHGAFALLRGEAGLHRLVEPGEGGGHTIHHARVAVWPHAPEAVLPLPLGEVAVEGQTLAARGHFFKKLRSAVTATHRPTGLSLTARGEATLHETEALALTLLRGWLLARRERLEPEPLPAWGDVVRTYQRHREQGARDHRTGTVIRSIRHVLSGRIHPFLLASLTQRGGGTS